MRRILTQLFKVTLTLAANSQSFRGHRGQIGEVYNDNFLSAVGLLAVFDPVLSELLKKSKNTVNYLSPPIQNEPIEVLANQLEHNIVSDITSANFFTIITDTTRDMSKIDQLSQVYRYVQIVAQDDGSSTALEICESFLSFYASTDHTAAGIYDQIIEITESKGLSFSKCRGQGYDGARTMSGFYTCNQKGILAKQPIAMHVHCAAHNLHFVVNDAIFGVKKTSSFFSTLEELYLFSGHSIRIWDILASITGESDVTRKKLNPTRWAGRLASVMEVKLRYTNVMKALYQIILLNANRDKREEAARLKKSLERYEFVLLVVNMSMVLLRLILLHSICNSRMRTCRRSPITYRRHRSTCQTTVASSLK